MRIFPSSRKSEETPAREIGQALFMLDANIAKALSELETQIKAASSLQTGVGSESVHPSGWRPAEGREHELNERSGVHSPEVSTPDDADSFKLRRRQRLKMRKVQRAKPRLTTLKPLKLNPNRDSYKKDGGVHRDFLDRGIRHGGTPSGFTKTFPSGMSGNPSESRQGVSYGIAPGDVYGSLENVTQDYPYEEMRIYQEDTIDVGPTEGGFTQREGDSNFSNKTRPRPARKNDENIRYYTTQGPDGPGGFAGDPQPLDYDQYFGLGNMMYPASLMAALAQESYYLRIDPPARFKRTEKPFLFTLYYRGEEQGGAVEIRVKSGKGMSTPTIFVIETIFNENTKKFEIKSVRPATEDPDNKMKYDEATSKWWYDAVLKRALDSKFFPSVFKPTTSLKKTTKKGYTVSQSPFLDEVAPGMTDIEKLFVNITDPSKWDSAGTAVIHKQGLDALRASSPKILEMLDAKSSGDEKYFGWNYVSKEDADIINKQDLEKKGKHYGAEELIRIWKKPAWDEALKQLKEKDPALQG